MLAIAPIHAVREAEVEALLDRAFGTDRRARTAYRLRAGTAAIPALSFAVHHDGVLAGTLQSWRVALASDAGPHVAMVMVGPVAVEPRHQQSGIGTALMHHMLAAVADSGAEGGAALMMIGDPHYYGRFGFTAARTGGWRLPGPFEPHRLLARGAGVPEQSGIIGPRAGELV